MIDLEPNLHIWSRSKSLVGIGWKYKLNYIKSMVMTKGHFDGYVQHPILKF